MVDGVYLDEAEWKMLASFAEKFGLQK